MKRIVPIVFIFIIIFSGCGSSKKQLQKGNYDAAVQKAVKQLRKDPTDAKQIDILNQAYKVANDQDNEKVRLLNMEGKSVEYPYVDYMPDMVNAKQKAADYYYNHGNELMKSGIKESYRQAFAEYLRAKEYVGDYEGIDSKIQDAKFQGMSRVFVSLQNSSRIKFPKEFEDDLLTLDLPKLNSDWVEYYTSNPNDNTQYDYYVNVNIKNVAVRPDQSLQRDSVIKRDIEDGYSYVLDQKGNVMRDSIGNDIKQKKYKTVQCALVETIQSKACRI